MLIELIERCLLLVVVNICEYVVNVSNVKLKKKKRVLLIYLRTFCDNPQKKINLSTRQIVILFTFIFQN